MPEEEKAKLITIDKLFSALEDKAHIIRRAEDGDESMLTAISFASKRHWGYPSKYFTIWEPELTITKQYLSENEVFVCEKDKEIVVYYSIVNLHEPLRIGEIEVERVTGYIRIIYNTFTSTALILLPSFLI